MPAVTNNSLLPCTKRYSPHRYVNWKKPTDLVAVVIGENTIIWWESSCHQQEKLATNKKRLIGTDSWFTSLSFTPTVEQLTINRDSTEITAVKNSSWAFASSGPTTHDHCHLDEEMKHVGRCHQSGNSDITIRTSQLTVAISLILIRIGIPPSDHLRFSVWCVVTRGDRATNSCWAVSPMSDVIVRKEQWCQWRGRSPSQNPNFWYLLQV
jgi:hypothetical protein